MEVAAYRLPPMSVHLPGVMGFALRCLSSGLVARHVMGPLVWNWVAGMVVHSHRHGCEWWPQCSRGVKFNK